MPGTTLVAGVGRRIGTAVVRELHAAGYEVGMFARSGDVIEELEAELDGTTAIKVDITDTDAVSAGVETVRDAHGPISALVLNASGGGGRPLDDASVDRLRSLFDVRVAGSLACVQAVRDDLEATDGTVLFSGTTFADGVSPQQVEWGAVAPAARGLATSLAHAMDEVQVTYVRIGTAVQPGADGSAVLAAEEAASVYRDLIEREHAVSREVDLYLRE